MSGRVIEPRRPLQSANQRVKLGLSGLIMVMLMLLLAGLLKGPDKPDAPARTEPLAQLGTAPGSGTPRP